MKDANRDWGVVRFDVATDLTKNIVHICTIAMSEHSRVSHFKVHDEPNVGNVLYLLWHERPGATELPYELNTPELMASFILTWLDQKAVYGNRGYGGGDGDDVKGVRISNCGTTEKYNPDAFYCVAAVEPEWIYYSK